MTGLSEFRLGGADVFVAAIDGKGYAEQHKAAYELLGAAFIRVYGQSRGALPPIEKTPEGKPYFADCPDIFFSISHTAAYAAVALSGRPVGIDIEAIRPYNKKIASRWLTNLAEDGDISDEGFTLAWTKLESLGKLTGKGITAAYVDGAEFYTCRKVEGYIVTVAEYGNGYGKLQMVNSK